MASFDSFSLKGKSLKTYLSPTRFVGDIHQPQSRSQFLSTAMDFHLSKQKHTISIWISKAQG
jgi:hypothetical protein